MSTGARIVLLGGGQTMVDVRIKLSALWVSLMLTYLLGDVLRIFSGDFLTVWYAWRWRRPEGESQR